MLFLVFSSCSLRCRCKACLKSSDFAFYDMRACLFTRSIRSSDHYFYTWWQSSTTGLIQWVNYTCLRRKTLEWVKQECLRGKNNRVNEESEMAESSNFTAPKFRGDYDHWSLLMENLFRWKEYCSVIESGINEPKENEPFIVAQQKALDEAKLKDLKAKNYLSKDWSLNCGWVTEFTTYARENPKRFNISNCDSVKNPVLPGTVLSRYRADCPTSGSKLGTGAGAKEGAILEDFWT